MKNTLKSPLHIVPDTTELDRQLKEQGRTDFVKPVLSAPYFPDDSKREVRFGRLGEILKGLAK